MSHYDEKKGRYSMADTPLSQLPLDTIQARLDQHQKDIATLQAEIYNRADQQRGTEIIYRALAKSAQVLITHIFDLQQGNILQHEWITKCTELANEVQSYIAVP